MPPSKPPASEEPRAERREEDRMPRPRGYEPPRKERLLKDDGRYVIFYDFEDEGEERG
jgi:hypothetical protein